MTNQIRDKNESKNCFTLFLEDCYNTLYDKSIMVDSSITKQIGENRSLFIKLTSEERKQVVRSLSDIMNYNQDFNEIVINYLIELDQPINLKNLIIIIKKKFKYQYYKARFFAVIKALLIILQLYVSIININSKNEESNSKEEEINQNLKFKILGKEIDSILFLKLMHFAGYDFVYILYDFLFLKNLKKKKLNKYIIILYQTLGYICNVCIYIILVINKKNFYKHANVKNPLY